MSHSELSVIMDGRFDRKDGKILSSHMHYDIFAKRILNVFDHVKIHARSFKTNLSSGLPVEGKDAKFVTIADYRGVREFLLQIPGIVQKCFTLARQKEPVLLYLPGTLPMICGLFRMAFKNPLHVLIVADPQDQMSKDALRHPLQPFFHKLYVFVLRFLCAHAVTAMYVTEDYLQSKYPPHNDARSFGTSDVNLSKDAYVKRARKPKEFDNKGLAIIYVAMMAQAYKAHEILINCISKLQNQGHDITLRLVGDGPLRPELEALAKELSVQDHIKFCGKLPFGEKINAELRVSDLFVMPSRAEGLPRALVEAMAQALPAISTSVGGVPEILPIEHLMPVDDTELLLKKLKSLVGNQAKLAQMSAENFKRAQDFSKGKIDQKINEFYKAIGEQNLRYSR